MQNLKRNSASSVSDRRGAIMPMFAVCIPLILAIGAFAINVAWMSLVDSEMQIVTDTSARAAGTEFTRTQNLLSAQNRAKEAIQKNKVGGRVLTLSDSDIVFGVSPLVTTAAPVGIAAFTPKSVTQGNLGSGPGQTWINAIQINKQQTFGFAEMPMPIPFLSASNGYRPAASATTTQFERDIVLVLDRSGSMNEYSTDSASWQPAGPGQAYYASRWRELTAAIQVFNDFLAVTPLNEQVALATFSTNATEDLLLSTDTTAIETRLNEITNDFQGGNTAIGDGIAAGINLITDSTRSRTFAKRTMIVMTDGIQNSGSPPRVKARQAQNSHGITVHCITFSDGADQVEGARIAAEGGGNHYHAASGAALADIFREIAKTLPTMLTR
ncbi:MAG: VWA domain-containing protein [Fuerstia sp.]|nr:VWA domain-containing protein [Fuerstiella sp.]